MNSEHKSDSVNSVFDTDVPFYFVSWSALLREKIVFSVAQNKPYRQLIGPILSITLYCKNALH